MMSARRTLLIALCFSALGIAPTLSYADAASDARKAIEANYSAMNAAIVAQHSAPAGKFLSKDAVFISTTGRKHDKAGYLASLNEMFAATKSIKVSTRIEKLTLKNGVATVLTRENLTASITDTNTGKVMPLKADARAEDIWVKSGTGWLLKRSKELSNSTTLDGQAIPNP